MTGGRHAGSDPGARGAIYRRLGVEPIINGGTTFTRLGGSLMPLEVVEAMAQAADSFVDLLELQEAVGRRLAALTGNEAAYVSAGAAAGLVLSAAVCMARDTDDGVFLPDDVDSYPRDFIIQRAHRFPYDPAIELPGGRLVEIGAADATSADELENALGPATAGVIYLAGEHRKAGVLPLDAVIAIAHGHDVPVIVDAAAQLPPRENLWRFTAAGADLCLFSGGKGLCGPAGTGLILGGHRYVDLLARNAAPLHRIGRPMKVGKEEMVGLLAAVEWYLGLDQAALTRGYEAIVGHFLEWGRGRADVEVTREPTGEAGQPTPRALVRLIGWSAESRDDLLATLRATPPRIHLEPGRDDGIYVAPETLLPGEERVVSARLAELMDPTAQGQDRAAASKADRPAAPKADRPAAPQSGGGAVD